VNINQPLSYMLQVREIQYAVAIGVVAVLVLLLLRRRPSPRAVVLFLIGAVVTLVAAPLLEASFSLVADSVGEGATGRLHNVFWREIAVGVAGAVVGVALMARAWRDSPER
jgi:hypothetical protein